MVLEHIDQLQYIPDEDLLMNQLRKVASDENAKKETLAALLIKILPNNIIDRLKELNKINEVHTESGSQLLSKLVSTSVSTSISSSALTSTSSPIVSTPVTGNTSLFSSQDVDLRSF